MNQLIIKNYFYYLNDEPVMLQDRVCDIPNHFGTITKIVIPHSEIANEMNEPEGGAFIVFDDGDKWLVSRFDTEVILIEHNNVAPESIVLDKRGLIEITENG